MYAGEDDELLVLSDALKAREAVPTTQEFITLPLDHQGFHKTNDSAYFENIIQNLEDYNGYTVLKPDQIVRELREIYEKP